MQDLITHPPGCGDTDEAADEAVVQVKGDGGVFVRVCVLVCKGDKLFF